MDYYTSLLNAVEHSVHLHVLFTTSAGELCLIIHHCAVKENKGLFASNNVFGITPHVVR